MYGANGLSPSVDLGDINWRGAGRRIVVGLWVVVERHELRFEIILELHDGSLEFEDPTRRKAKEFDLPHCFIQKIMKISIPYCKNSNFQSSCFMSRAASVAEIFQGVDFYTSHEQIHSLP